MEMEKAETGVTKRPRGGENMLSLKSGGEGGEGGSRTELFETREQRNERRKRLCFGKWKLQLPDHWEPAPTGPVLMHKIGLHPS